MNQWLVLAGVAAMTSLGTSQLVAQPNGGPGGGPGGRGNFDPAQFRQQMMDNVKQALEVTSDDEWKVLEPRVQKIMDARMEMGGGGMGRFMMGRRNRGGDNAPADQGARRRFGPPPSQEEEALQKAIDSKASKAEMKAALDKYVASRKTKQADMEKAQAALRELLTPRQEAIATLNGLL
jgi:Spy/CpxP family protein refolding chaperone